MTGTLTPIQRFFLAFIAFFYVLMSRRFAEEVKQIRDRERSALPPPTEPEQAAPSPGPTPAVTPEPSAGDEPPPYGSGPTGATPPTPTASDRPSEPPAPSVAPVPSAAPPQAEPSRGAAQSRGAPTPDATSPHPRQPPTSVPATAAPEPAKPPPAPALPPHTEALQVLTLLQRDGRLIDFLSESLEGFSDREIGAAARTVHSGCRKALDAYLELEPVFREAEGASVTVAPGFDPAAVRLTGNVVGQPPFKGSLRHHGWRVTRAAFPPPPTSQDPRIIAPAEVEL